MISQPRKKKYQEGYSTSFALYVLVLLLFGIWFMSNLLIQENHTYRNFKDYVAQKYKVDAVHESFMYQIRETLSSSSWTLQEIQAGTAKLVDEQDAAAIRNFLVSNTHYKQPVGIQSVDVETAFPEWLDGTCSAPLPSISETGFYDLCAKLEYTVDGISDTVYIRVDNIELYTFPGNEVRVFDCGGMRVVYKD